MAYHHSQDSHHNIAADATTPLLLPTNDPKTYHNYINKSLTPTTGTCCGHTCCHAHTRNIERDLVKPSYHYTQYRNAADWLLMFEEVARANNWSPRAKLDILAVYLQEGYPPRTWFRQNQYLWESAASGGTTDAEEAGFEVFREAFLREFGKDGEGVMSRIVSIFIAFLIFWVVLSVK